MVFWKLNLIVCDRIDAVYADGEIQPSIPGGFYKVQEINIPAGTSVLAIKASYTGGEYPALRACLHKEGNLITTSALWKCATNVDREPWMDTTFDDSSWSYAYPRFDKRDDGQGKLIPGDAEYIWTEKCQAPFIDQTVYFRVNLNPC